MLNRGRTVIQPFVTDFFKDRIRQISSATPATLETYVWLPAIKIRDSSHAVIKREILSSRDAKKRFASEDNKGVDPWGHAAAKVSINGLHKDIPPELIDTLQEEAIRSGTASLKDSKSINSLQAYLSWYPKVALTGGFTQEEEKEWIQGVSVDDTDVNAGKKASLGLFSRRYSAANGNYEADLDGYGNPDSALIFSNDLDFTKIIKTCFTLMHPVLRGNTIVMTRALPNATYYGKAMLREHRLVSMLLSENDQMLGKLNENELDRAAHVCTTANLFLLKSGLGEEQYYRKAKQIFQDNPELAHGFPMADFTYAFVKHLHKNSTPAPISTIDLEPVSKNKPKP